ncbi:hypothetical protein F1D05_13535 [Kribbella qitaiheensis]|uniref:DUF6875 domain-containing protein n=1 Tax=Kribbella qitaiheensis TaxID=1544730 RepID=A0A7G6WXM6_9ACTN|nr:hypothetical protein [Kribbella qitaiheensis]QNE18741.1 hypothetical protein F1D05_13535 [Kribbella qitaiheensis]
MLTYAGTDSLGLHLYSGSDLPPEGSRHRATVDTILQWASGYLSNPHEELGRNGPVCPFVSASLRKALFRVAVHPGTPDPDEVAEMVLRYKAWFGSLEPTEGAGAQFKTVLIAFPDLDDEAVGAVIDGVQLRLKPSFVADGLMLGQFHQLPPEAGGLWNPDFRPLHAPVALLAIRHMVRSDLPFLVDEPAFVTQYEKLFGTA